jgi:hypothetical protein
MAIKSWHMAAVGAVLAVCTAVPALAHHSLAAE